MLWILLVYLLLSAVFPILGFRRGAKLVRAGCLARGAGVFIGMLALGLMAAAIATMVLGFYLGAAMSTYAILFFGVFGFILLLDMNYFYLFFYSGWAMAVRNSSDPHGVRMSKREMRSYVERLERRRKEALAGKGIRKPRARRGKEGWVGGDEGEEDADLWRVEVAYVTGRELGEDED